MQVYQSPCTCNLSIGIDNILENREVRWDKLKTLIRDVPNTVHIFWIIVLPIFAFLVISIKGAAIDISEYLKGDEFVSLNFQQLSIFFPLAWKIVYFSIVSTIASKKLFSLWCPWIIIECNSYEDYINSTISIDELRERTRSYDAKIKQITTPLLIKIQTI